MRKNYNPWLLPPCLRKIRFYCKAIVIPICCFQLIRTLFVPTTGDFLLLICLIGLCVAFHKDLI
ncbi:hypothetical protein [Bhargavaea massiliensis]|uniref:hypothetical protein n=1 Tax=Bhargavaea massiliensis TaxID=2697500 RepID=UPI001BCB6752|nr:hypothetical protein [Bhargavaea massiliensis]